MCVCCLAVVPIKFIQQLKNIQAEEGTNILLRCELSKPDIPVEWRRGQDPLQNGVKHQMRKRETTLELLIWKPKPEDSGIYSCVCAGVMTSATVRINGSKPFTKKYNYNVMLLWPLILSPKLC